MKGAIAETTVLFPIPLEDLRLVLFPDASTLKRVLLEEQVYGSISTAAFGDMHQLVVIPVLAQNSLRPGRLAIKEIDDVIRTILTYKGSEEDDGVRTEVHLAVEAPFVIRVLQHLSQVRSELRINHELT